MSTPVKVGTANGGDTASAVAVIVFALLGLTGAVGTPVSGAAGEAEPATRLIELAGGLAARLLGHGFTAEGLRDCLNVLIR